VLANDPLRLPTAEDRPDLPYVDALVKEVFRWQNVVPLGVPHRLTAEDTHAGHRIPAGSVVIANIWAMTHDPNTYADPLVFRPERFLGATPERDPRELVFGFGRRVCPGQHLAEVSVWLACALSLAAFSIRPAPGAPLPEPKMSDGTISHPAPFACSIEPRSESMAELVRAVSLTNE
jgi:cytochrome P450